MWPLLRAGVLTHMSSDHAPSTLEQKRARDIWNQFGLPGLDGTFTLLLDAAARGHLTYEDVARVYSEAPARAYGLWPHKGSLLPGADTAWLSSTQPRSVRCGTETSCLAGWTPYARRTVAGQVVRTYLRSHRRRGRCAADPRTGRFRPGAGAAASLGA